LRAWTALEGGPSSASFLQAVEEALGDTLGHLGLIGQGVFVAPLGAATAMDFDVTHVMGMIEGTVPPRNGDDPLLPDRDRQLAGGPSEGLSLQQSRSANERYSFLVALSTAPVRVLSFPRAEPGAQRKYYPSRWFLDQASALEKSQVYTSTLGSLDTRPWLRVIPSIEQALTTVSEVAAADRHDYDLERLWRWRRAGLRLEDHPIAQSRQLIRALAMVKRRWWRSLTEWDGDVSSLAGVAGRVNPLASSPLSPTSLSATSLATCWASRRWKTPRRRIS
jgi:ATP-dependent helicase/nuclease subunit B